MSEKNVKVLNDENGYIIINMYGREFVSCTPLEMVDGKFRASEVEKLLFGTMI